MRRLIAATVLALLTLSGCSDPEPAPVKKVSLVTMTPDRQVGYDALREVAPDTADWTNFEIDQTSRGMCMGLEVNTYDEMIDSFIASGATASEMVTLSAVLAFAERFDCPEER